MLDGDAMTAASPSGVQGSSAVWAAEPPPAPSDHAFAALRLAIDGATRLPEAEAIAALVAQLPTDTTARGQIRDLALQLAARMRHHRARARGVDALMHEFSLSSHEGLALMGLAEALLRVPDSASRLDLIRDKLADGDWAAHVGHSPSWFVNLAAWCLSLTGRVLAPHDTEGLAAGLGRLAAAGGQALVLQAMEQAMGLVGQQFVMGETIGAALERAAQGNAAAYRYSFDMLGEAALCAEDARTYASAYAQAIEAIGAADHWRGVQRGNGISIKLSALHPRYGWAQRERVLAELLPRVRQLCLLAKQHDIGLTIDAEEADRLELSLDVLQALASDPALADWAGLGFVVQAYQKRAPRVLDWIIALARRSGRRLMVRLVKGAYWDSEIKRAQLDGLVDYPVYTRKAHTDIAYLACARQLLAAPDAVFPLFATHNAHTLASILHMAGPFRPGDYEFQGLHGMGQGLYDAIVNHPDAALRRPVRIYAPVGSHRSLLAYLVRRLLENGANTSFVHHIVDEALPLEILVADPLDAFARSAGQPHPAIPLPLALYPERMGAQGPDLASAQVRQALLASLAHARGCGLLAAPITSVAWPGQPFEARPVHAPAALDRVLGEVRDTHPLEIAAALEGAQAALPAWQALGPQQRARVLHQVADALAGRGDFLACLLVEEAGKTWPAAWGELREAVDFCRYYAARLLAGDLDGSQPVGLLLAISPWNFPLAIFVGQIAAGLATGNGVIAKPAEQTPLIADQALRLFHAAGVPRGVLQCLPGPGETVGAALVADARIDGVLFTGSTDVARLIHQRLAARGVDLLVAETGGINAMVVDSTALPEQVVADVISSTFDSAGQRCSALRLLCVQEDIAERVFGLLDAALAEWRVGPPAAFSTDMGPLIDGAALARVRGHLEQMEARGFPVLTRSLPAEATHGHYLAPALIRVTAPEDVPEEIFGPVLHLLAYPAAQLDSVLARLDARGYGLTLGVQSRVEGHVQHILGRMRVGNAYVNRNMIGAVVGVQPFGGEGLSGTGPKAGGPLSLRRLVRYPAPPLPECPRPARPGLDRLATWLEGEARSLLDEPARLRLLETLARARRYSLAGVHVSLPGPTGEQNTLGFYPRGAFLGLPRHGEALLGQWIAALATGNRYLLLEADSQDPWLAHLPPDLRQTLGVVRELHGGHWDGVLADLPAPALADWRQRCAAVPGPIRPFLVADPDYALERMVVERCITVNTAATGGNPQLMQLDEAG